MTLEVKINTTEQGKQPSYFLDILAGLLQNGRFPNGCGDMIYRHEDGGTTYFTINSEV